MFHVNTAWIHFMLLKLFFDRSAGQIWKMEREEVNMKKPIVNSEINFSPLA